LLDPELSPLEGVEEALRKMGIAPVGELVSEDEQRAIEKELQQQQDDDEGSSDDKDESSSPEEGATTPTK
jgi:hypothetical protein